MMKRKPEEVVNLIVQKVQHLEKNADVQAVGKVVQVGDGVITVYGLEGVRTLEIISNAQGAKALVLSLEVSSVGAVILGSTDTFSSGDEVCTTGEFLTVPVGESLLGRVVNARGEPLDGFGAIAATQHAPVEAPAPGILDRKSVDTPLQTGLKVIDSLVPIGRGQRELIIGDRQLGKTAIAVDTIINQAQMNAHLPDDQKVYSVYVAVGQKMSKIVNMVQKLRDLNALQYVTIVSASASDPAAYQFLAPYAGCAMGEYFRDSGQHALVIYDDLSKQAIAYREISLVLRRPPGREAFPGDIFYLHARLLERAAQMSDAKGGGSLTALPIVETQEGDLSSYIATNVISITDGQVFLETSLFHEGITPSVNVGYSVSRVGSAAQSPAIKKLSGTLRLELAQYKEMASFAKFASDVNVKTRKLLSNGEALVEMFKQAQYEPLDVAEQIVSLYYFAEHKEEALSPQKRVLHVQFIREHLRRNKKLVHALNNHKKYDDALIEKIESIIVASLKLLGEKSE